MKTQHSKVKSSTRLSEEDNPGWESLALMDAINKRLNSLKIVETYLSDCLEQMGEEKIKFVGKWSIEYFDSAIMTIQSFIDDVEDITS